jgi:RND superfamily putative drug exporter
VRRVLQALVSSRLSSWITLGVAILISGAAFGLLSGPASDSYPQAGLPDDVQSARVSALLEEGPDADATAALFVFDREDGAKLSDTEVAAVADAAGRLAEESTAPQAVAPIPSDDGTAVIVTVPLDQAEVEDDLAGTADHLRQVAGDGLPDGMRALLTGPVGFQADTANAFAGADFRLLLITVIVVGVLLIITYRSPVLWIVPLLTVGIADGLARFVVTAAGDAIGFTIDPSISGIQSVLVFGAGTNYALLLVARYREELLRQSDRFAAMRTAVRGAGAAILASGSTVILSLLLLLLGSLDSTRALGFACALGILIALAFGLLVLPAALVVCGRGLFWPFVPRVTSDATGDGEAPHGLWSRIGRAASRRPLAVIAGSVVVLAVLALGGLGFKVGLPQVDQFVGNPESAQAQDVLERSYPAGLTSPAVVLARDAVADDAASLIEGTDGVASVRPGASWDGRTQLTVTLDAAPQSAEAFGTIEALRTEFSDRGGELADTLVGGADATALDVRDASQRDQRLILPLIIAVVFGILALLLRSLVAPVILIATVLATFFASIGASTWIFQNILGFAAFDTSVVLYGFLFLVALGVDYNIFLVTRAREERLSGVATTPAMITAVGTTGAVITSAGVLLAAVFVVLGVLPVVALAQIGVIVCIGVLLDTLLVRTVLVPAIVFLLGDAFWWPGLSRAVTRAR